jgi:hypothetical protein
VPYPEVGFSTITSGLTVIQAQSPQLELGAQQVALGNENNVAANTGQHDATVNKGTRMSGDTLTRLRSIESNVDIPSYSDFRIPPSTLSVPSIRPVFSPEMFNPVRNSKFNGGG